MISLDLANPVITKIFVREGYIVRKHQPLIEVETEKAIVRVASEVDGVVLLIMARMDQMVKEGDALLIIKERA